MGIRIHVERTDGSASATRRRTLTVAAATVVAVVLVGGVSYAFWSATGSGNATVSAVTAQALTVGASSPVVADLYPGKPTESLAFVITNPNSYAVNVSSASFGTATSSDAVNCPIGNLAIASGPFALSVTVPAGGSANASIANAVQMKTTAGDGCQGKTFTIPITVTGTQQ
jgi:hypothetical protein